ncbi:hypothetical protein OIO90_000798 [Microbotryomycetes sp. JL221]|nr:hypothetical protein OIO90_000798 [Microbotryomycetes sp. JL221]
MTGLFKRKRSLLKLGSRDKHESPSNGINDSSQVYLTASRDGSNHGAQAHPTSQAMTRVYVDDFGRPIVDDRPAFSADSVGLGTPHEGTEQRMLFGYMQLEATLELPIDRVSELVNQATDEIKQRGLETPLILSSMALDISAEGTNSLVRSCLMDRHTFSQDLKLAEPHAVASFLKWSLARLVNERGGRGFLDYAVYEDFKHSERTTSYPPKHLSQALLSRLDSPNNRLLSTLLSLFSSICAHSKANGMPPRKLAALFSPFVFGLSDDATFDATYAEWQRGTSALEHIILAHIRDQEADGPLPTHLTRYLVGYPQSLNITYERFETPKPPKTARMVPVTRFRRLTRFHSRNLIASAGTWDVPQSSLWPLFFPQGQARKQVQPGELPQTVYTSYYRHLLNIRSSSMVDEDDLNLDDNQLGRFRTRAEQEWTKFGEIGFKDVDNSKLEFDLGESQRKQVGSSTKRDTIDWSTFESLGFSGRGNNLDLSSVDLTFNERISTKVNTWPASQQMLNRRLREAEKLLPEFNFDTTAHEEGTIQVDAMFFEAWADALVSSGWARDELKESSFALIQWRRRTKPGEAQSQTRGSSTDDRTEDSWVLIEEFVPRDYRERLALGKTKKRDKRISFLRTVKRKDSTRSEQRPSARNITPTGTNGGSFFFQPPLASTSSSKQRSNAPPSSLQPIDESVFQPGSDTTKQMSLSTVTASRAGAPHSIMSHEGQTSAYAPSVVSTTNAAGHGHSESQFEVNTVNTVSEYDPRSSTMTDNTMQPRVPVDTSMATTTTPSQVSDSEINRAPSRQSAHDATGLSVDNASRSPRQPDVTQFGSSSEQTQLAPPIPLLVTPTETTTRPLNHEPIGFTKESTKANNKKFGNGFLSRISSHSNRTKAKKLLSINNKNKSLSFGNKGNNGNSTFAFSADPPSPTNVAASGVPHLGATVEDNSTPPPLPPKGFNNSGAEETLNDQSDEAYGGISSTIQKQRLESRQSSSDDQTSITSSGGILRRGSANGSVSSLTKRKPVPQLDGGSGSVGSGRESLPPSPKPDAEVPTDQRESYLSQESEYSSRVRTIVGLYEGRDVDSLASPQLGGQHPIPAAGTTTVAGSTVTNEQVERVADGIEHEDNTVRLSQFGFGQTSTVQGS